MWASLLLNILFLSGWLALGWHFRERVLQFYLTWKGKADLVFFGDSITAQGDWNTLLNRCDIKNSGIPGLGLIHLKEEINQQVLSYQPRFCLVMGGINDLTLFERTASETIADYREILSKLQEANIETVVQLTLYERKNPVSQNKVDSLNRWLVSYCDSVKIKTIDPNLWLSDHSGLLKEFARDRTHLTQSAYHTWADHLKTELASQLR